MNCQLTTRSPPAFRPSLTLQRFPPNTQRPEQCTQLGARAGIGHSGSLCAGAGGGARRQQEMSPSPLLIAESGLGTGSGQDAGLIALPGLPAPSRARRGEMEVSKSRINGSKALPKYGLINSKSIMAQTIAMRSINSRPGGPSKRLRQTDRRTDGGHCRFETTGPTERRCCSVSAQLSSQLAEPGPLCDSLVAVRQQSGHKARAAQPQAN